MSIIKKEQLNMLIKVAVSDGILNEDEENSLRKLAKLSDINQEEFDQMMKASSSKLDVSNMNSEQRFETLYHVIQMMKVDGKIFKSEINFCKDMADKLGYKKSVISKLSPYIFANKSITTDINKLMKIAEKFYK